MSALCVVTVDEFEDGSVELCRGTFCSAVEAISELILSGVASVSLFLLSESLFDAVLLLSASRNLDMVSLLSLASTVLSLVALSGFVIPVCVDDSVCCGSGDLFVVSVAPCKLLSSEGFVESPELDHKSEPEPERSSLSLSLSSRLSFVKLVALGSLKISPSKASGALRRSTADAAGGRKSEN